MSPLLYLLSYTATHMVCTKGHPPRQGFSQRTGERWPKHGVVSILQ